ncbi:MAG TPA: tRNA (N6-isopentenyl adenosine(37)-C2)-methylthiotransferase MiaB [Planctomycetes bacterium]|nr:tRNA (N6-isopentenyl adenosine(37)-C2)-methylthiotransferase MiaB [Planctomycetota bacterium]
MVPKAGPQEQGGEEEGEEEAKGHTPSLTRKGKRQEGHPQLRTLRYDSRLSPGKRTMDRRKFFLLTYGCQMNKLDSELIASRMIQAGFEETEREEEAQVLLLNTCSIRESAEDRVWGRIGAMKARKKKDPEVIIGVLGCMAQEHKVFLRTRMPHIDVVCGTREFGRIDALVRESIETRKGVIATGEGGNGDLVQRELSCRPMRAQAFVNIIRGCNMPCTYCIVPATRGPEVSRPVDAIREEVERLVADGVTEVTLLGQTVNAYGHDLERGTDLALLLRELHQIPALRRISFVTSHPSFLTPRLMEAMAALPRVSRYFHLPAQSGSNQVLKAMKRGYTRERYLARIRDLKGLIPEMEFACDFIAGFPGETEEDHRQSLSLIEEVGFSQSFVFKYSPRKGTVSADYLRDDVPEEVKARRNQELLQTQERVSLARNRAQVGEVREILVEGPSKTRKDRYTGRTARNRIVHFANEDPNLVGRYVPVRIVEAQAHSLIGVLQEETRTVLEGDGVLAGKGRAEGASQ